MTQKISQLSQVTTVLDSLVIPAAGSGSNVGIPATYLAHPRLGKRLMGNINNTYTRHWKEQLSVAQSTYSSTYGLITKAPCTEYTHVRVVLKNAEATPPAVTGVLLAATASNANKTVPTTGNTLTNDGATGWVQATFGGSNTPTLVAGTQAAPSVLISDWMPLNSIAPTDGATYPYVMARIKMGGNYSAIFTGLLNTDNTKDTYLEMIGSAGDYVTTPQSLTSGSAQSFSPIFGLEFLSSSRVVKILCVGSSTTQGFGSTPIDSAYRSWVPITQETLLAAGIPANLFNYGYATQTTTTYAAYGKTAIDSHLPAMVFYQVFSPNDGTPSQNTINAQYQRAMDFANYAMAKNCLPIFLFTNPNNNYDATTDNFRKSLITRCKASGFAVCDLNTAVGDGATPERFQSGMNYDALHPNDTGYAAMAAVAVSVIKDILSRNITY
jgi:lysophospholipase L1-like esterase